MNLFLFFFFSPLFHNLRHPLFLDVEDNTSLTSLSSLLVFSQVFQVEAPPGCFYPPTLITDVGTTSKTVVEEIFGPVLVAMPFRYFIQLLQLFYLVIATILLLKRVCFMVGLTICKVISFVIVMLQRNMFENHMSFDTPKNLLEFHSICFVIQELLF